MLSAVWLVLDARPFIESEAAVHTGNSDLLPSALRARRLHR